MPRITSGKQARAIVKRYASMSQKSAEDEADKLAKKRLELSSALEKHDVEIRKLEEAESKEKGRLDAMIQTLRSKLDAFESKIEKVEMKREKVERDLSDLEFRIDRFVEARRDIQDAEELAQAVEPVSAPKRKLRKGGVYTHY